MKKILFPFLLIISFLIMKFSNNGIRLSDTNTYFNIAYQMSHGKILYKDIFFSNFPFFSYLSYFYYFLSGKNINLFYFTSEIEVALITLLIYFISYRKTKDYIVSITASLLYILSFMVLSTSDHQTGVFTACLFAVLSYYFLQEKKFIISGIFIALSVSTKAYFLPVFLSIFTFIALKKKWSDLFKLCLAGVITGIITLLPALIQAPKQLISDIFGFSLTRPVGLVKTDILWFFITKDFLLFILLIFNIFNIRKNTFFGLVSIFSIIFFFGYGDIYYLYLNFLTPFLCLSFYELDYLLKNKLNPQKLVIPTIVLILISFNLISYLSGYRNLGKLENIDVVLKTIKAENPKYLYGVIDITPALIAITGIPALENVNGAHDYFFIRKIYDRKFLTDKAATSRTIVVTEGADYPQSNIKEDILDDTILVKETVYKNCKNILSIPVQSEGDANRINLFKCY